MQPEAGGVVVVAPEPQVAPQEAQEESEAKPEVDEPMELTGDYPSLEGPCYFFALCECVFLLYHALKHVKVCEVTLCR